MRCGHCNVRVSCDPAQPAVYNTMWQVFAALGRARRAPAAGAWRRQRQTVHDTDAGHGCGLVRARGTSPD
jgi:hypothetical protein